jgi:hypothetical protein
VEPYNGYTGGASIFRAQYLHTRSLIFQVGILNGKWIETLNMGNAEAYKIDRKLNYQIGRAASRVS